MKRFIIIGCSLLLWFGGCDSLVPQPSPPRKTECSECRTNDDCPGYFLRCVPFYNQSDCSSAGLACAEMGSKVKKQGIFVGTQYHEKAEIITKACRKRGGRLTVSSKDDCVSVNNDHGGDQ